MAKSQIFFWLLTAFIAGIAVASFLPPLLPLVWAVFISGGALAAFAGLRPAERVLISVIGFALMVSAFGMFWFMRSAGPPAGLPPDSAGKAVSLRGLVSDDPSRRAASQRFMLRLEGGTHILVTTRPYPEYRYGEALTLGGRIEEPENFSDDFDYRAYLAKDDIYFVMAFPNIERVAVGGGNPLYRFLFSLKREFSGKLSRYLAEPHAAFMAGLLLGERQSFSPEFSEQLKTTGTSHIVALSGYNITIVAEALMSTLMFLFLPFAWAFWVAIAGIVAFTLLTGAAASVVRAAVMGVLVLVAHRAGRVYRVRNAIAFAAAAMLLANPKLLRFDVGFQLSFFATLGLVYGTPLIERAYNRASMRLALFVRDLGLVRERRERPRRGRKPFLKGVFISTMAAQLAVLPLIVYHFGTLSLVAPIANLAILPVIPTTMFFGFLSGGLAFVSDALASAAAAAAWALLAYELGAIGFFARLPYAALAVPWLGLIALLGGYAFAGWRLWHDYRQPPSSA